MRIAETGGDRRSAPHLEQEERGFARCQAGRPRREMPADMKPSHRTSRGGRSKANAEIAGLKAQLKKLAADVLSGEVERGAATAVNQIINSQARLLELERKIKETEELEARLEALEVVLKARSSG